MNPRHNNVSRISAIGDIYHSMFVPHHLYTVIPRPAIRSKNGSSLHIIFDESPKTWRRQVGNLCHTNSTRATTTHFRSYCNDRLPFSTPATDLRPNPPDVCFVNFNLSGQLIPSGAHHCTAQFVKPIPGSIIAAKTKDPLQSKSTGSMFLTRDKPHGKEPSPKRFVTPMKQSSSGDGRLAFAFPTEEKTTPHQEWLISFFPTTGTSEAFRPSKFRDILKASVFAGKPFIKILKCFRIIYARNRMPWLFYEHMLHLVAG